MNFLRQIFQPLKISSTGQKHTMALYEPNVKTEKATFCMGCFWLPDAVYGCMPGVIHTRVGYTGGLLKDPTYKHLGDHTEGIDIDYDPTKVSYEKLLEVFWKYHNPTAKNKKQYSSFIFYHNDDQKKLATESLEKENKQTLGILTEILPAAIFYNAEDYHQKYRLQGHTSLMDMLKLKPKDVITSHVAARLNGFVGGVGPMEQFDEEWPQWGISSEAVEYIRRCIIKNYGNIGPC